MQIYIRLRETCQRAQIELEETPDHPLYERIHQSLQQTVLTAEQRLGKMRLPHRMNSVIRKYAGCSMKAATAVPEYAAADQRCEDSERSITEAPANRTGSLSGGAPQRDGIADRHRSVPEEVFSELTFRCTGLDDILVTLQETGNEAELLKWLEQTIRWKIPVQIPRLNKRW